MFNHRIYNYWTCSRFADFIRGTPKPKVLTSAGWNQWKTTTQKNSPIRYYLAEDFLNTIQKIIMSPISLWYNIIYYLHNRYIVKTHTLVSNLTTGQWYDYDTRLLHASFDELVNYVQIECAYKFLRFDHITFTHSNKLVNYFKPWRNEEAGLKYLDLLIEMGYDDSIRKIKQLYMWWIYTRPSRNNSNYVIDNQEYEQEDTQKLIELIKIRTFLWT